MNVCMYKYVYMILRVYDICDTSDQLVSSWGLLVFTDCCHADDIAQQWRGGEIGLILKAYIIYDTCILVVHCSLHTWYTGMKHA